MRFARTGLLYFLLMVLNTFLDSSQTLCAAPIPPDIAVLDLSQRNDITGSYLVHVDRQKLSPKSIVSGAQDHLFSPVTDISFLGEPDPIWLKLRLENSSLKPITVHLAFEAPRVRSIIVYGKSLASPLRTGTAVKIEDRPVKGRNHAVSLDVGPGGSDFYIVYRYHGSFAIKTIVTSPKTFYETEAETDSVYLFMYGGFLLIFFYNLGVALSLRRLEYWAYSLFILASLVREAFVTGMYERYLPSGLSHYFRLAASQSFFVSLVLAALFTTLFLNLRWKKNRLSMLAAIFLVVMATVQYLSTYLAGPRISYRLLFLAITVNAIITFSLGLVHYFKGQRTARYFTLAWGFALFGFVANIMFYSGSTLFGPFGPFMSGIGQSIEIVFLSFAFSDKVAQMRRDREKEQREFNRRLEMKVEEKTRDIRSLLDNIHQGVMAIESDGNKLRIAPDHSKRLVDFFEGDFVGCDPFEHFFPRTDIGPDVLGQIQMALETSMGMEYLQYEVNAHILPDRCHLLVNGMQKTVTIDWDPVVDSSDNVVKILVSLKDVTELMRIEEERQRTSDQLKLLTRLVQLDTNKFHEFHVIVGSHLSGANEMSQLLASASASEREAAIRQIYRDLHTAKGISRTYGFSDLNDGIHAAENACQELTLDSKDQIETQRSIASLITSIENARTVLDAYDHVNRNVLGRGGVKGIMVSREFIEERVRSLQDSLGKEDLSRLEIAKVALELKQVYCKNLEALLSEELVSCRQLAEKMGKKAPNFVFNEMPGLLLAPGETAYTLKSCFTHLIRNSLDHGLEAPDVRRASHKPERGTISIESSLTRNGRVRIGVRDDGQGLKLDAIEKRAIERGLIKEIHGLSAEELAMLIFKPGFSTASTVSDISGRGVGMDAVLSSIEGIGGTVSLKLGAISENRRAEVMFLMELPLSCFEYFDVVLAA